MIQARFGGGGPCDWLEGVQAAIVGLVAWLSDPGSELVRDIFQWRPEATTWYFRSGRINPENRARDLNAAMGINRAPVTELALSPAWQTVMCARPLSDEMTARGDSIRMSSPEDVALGASFCSTIDPLEMDEHCRDRFVKLAKLYNMLAAAVGVSLFFMASWGALASLEGTNA